MRYEYLIATSLDEAFAFFKAYGERARYIAGGTDIIVRLKQRALDLDCLVSLRRIPDLSHIRDGEYIRIGGLCTFRELLDSEVVKRELPSLSAAASVLANPQVRNVATIGGNLCNAAPSADSVPPLMALDAKVVLRGPEGKREVNLEDFFIGPGKTAKESYEILEEIIVRPPGSSWKTSFLKMGRVKQDIAVVNVGVALALEGSWVKEARIVAGAVGPTPLRLYKAEERLKGNEVNQGLLSEVQEIVEKEVRPISDVRASLEYRRHLSGVLVKRAILQCLSN